MFPIAPFKQSYIYILRLFFPVFFFFRIASGFPDSRTSLLHQKLQMLNICMDRRRIREGNLSFAMANAHKAGKAQDDSEDEFFDCADEDEDREKNKHLYATWNKPEGRLSKLNDMRLVDSDEPLYVPITQEPVPKTEDQLEDDAEVMLKLGPGSGKWKTFQ